MKTIAVYCALVIFSSPAAMQVPPGEGIDFPGVNLQVNCYGGTATAVYDGKLGWDTGVFDTGNAFLQSMQVTIKLAQRGAGPAGPMRFDTITVNAWQQPKAPPLADGSPGSRGKPLDVRIWSGDGARNDFPLASSTANSATFDYLRQGGLAISW